MHWCMVARQWGRTRGTIRCHRRANDPCCCIQQRWGVHNRRCCWRTAAHDWIYPDPNSQVPLKPNEDIAQSVAVWDRIILRHKGTSLEVIMGEYIGAIDYIVAEATQLANFGSTVTVPWARWTFQLRQCQINCGIIPRHSGRTCKNGKGERMVAGSEF